MSLAMRFAARSMKRAPGTRVEKDGLVYQRDERDERVRQDKE
jgi:hypothetical protein